MKKYKVGKNIIIAEKKDSGFFSSKKILFILVALVIILMVGSMLVMFFEKGNNQEGGTVYNNYRFFYDPQKGWMTKVNGQDVSFEFLPSELEGSAPGSFYGFNLGKTYVSFNPNEFSENSYEIKRLLGFLVFTGRKALPACSSDNNCGDLPVVECSENSTNNIIFLYIGNETKINQEGNCLKLESKPGDEIKVIGLFIYKLLGIMN